jgi:uncharacterized surface protein with fasciclin (FAS1) repeats
MYKKSTIKKVGSILVVVAIMASALTVMGVKSASGEDDGLLDIVETAVENGNFTTLVTAVTEAGLVPTLSGAGPFTVFAPNDDAFANLPEGTINKLLNNLDVLTDILTYHVVSGNYTAADITGLTTLTTVQGEDLTIDTTSGVMVDGAEVILADVNCANGIIHVIDNVMVPPSAITAVTVDYPMGGENIGGMIPVAWTAANDADLDLDITLEYKNDTATEWTLITEGEENDGMYAWDATALDGSEQYMLKITAMDPIGLTYFAESGLFDISDMTATPKTIAYNETDDLHVMSTSGTVTIYNPDGIAVASDDGSPGDVFFFGTVFDDTGTWWVEDSVEGLFYILVTPIGLNVTAAPEEVEFTKSGSESYVEVSGQVFNPDGTATTGATVEIWAPGVSPSSTATPIKAVTTNATGHYVFSTQIRISLYGAGIYNVTARIGPIDDADALGFAHMTVTPVEANVTLFDMEDVSGGFAVGEIVFEVLYPDGTGLLAGNDFNASVWMGDMLYAWHNTSDGTTGDNITFAPFGKYLNMTPVDIWESGDYSLMVEVDYAGDISWEYAGEADFTIPEPDPVNIFVDPTTIDVEALALNAQIITVQVLGETLYTYGDPTNLSVGPAPDYENITDRIMIEGDLLYTPPAGAYEYIGEGTWEITVFPVKGDGNIDVDVSWPDNGTDSKEINITNGGHITVDPTTVIVDNEYDVTITVKTKDGNPVTRVEEIQLYYEVPDYYEGTAWTLIDQKTGAYDPAGVFTFANLTIDQAAVNVVVFAHFLTDADQYAYARIRSNPAHDLTVALAPSDVLLGEQIEHIINITRNDAPYADTFELYLFNASEYAEFSNDELDVDDMTPIATKTTANFTVINIISEVGTYYLYVRTADKKHDNMGSEPSFEVTAADVSVSPSLLVKHVDKDMTLDFTVTWNGEAVNGTLYVYGIAETASYEGYVDGGMVEVPIVEGEGNLTNVTATHLTNDTDMITFGFASGVSGSLEAEADGDMEVVPPTVSVIPQNIFLAEESLITLTVTHPLTNNPVPDMEVMAALPSGNMNLGETDSNGQVSFGIVPMVTGLVTLMVEGDEVDQQIEIGIGLKVVVDSDLEVKQEITITVTTRGGTPVEGATVKFGTETIGTTDENGEITYEPEDDGDFTISVSKSGYAGASRTVTVEEGPGTPGFALFGAILGVLAALLIVRRRRR